jgi:2-methylcitrate dehydratase PrpD
MLEDSTAGSTATLASWVADLSFDALGPAVQTRIPLHLLDFAGVAAAGKQSAESSDHARAAAFGATAGAVTGDSACTVVGEVDGLAPDLAAFLNGTYAHSQDFDDTTIASSLHPGAPVIAAALPLAETLGTAGSHLITAIAAGYEVACRVGEALGQSPYQRGFHPTAVAGVFGAVSAGAVLLELDAEQVLNALGTAGSMAAGSLQCLEDGTWNKRIHPGLAARNALFSLDLARCGFRAATAALEGRKGTLQAFSDSPNVAVLTQDLGRTWRLLDTGVKPYPACRLTHGAIDAALALRPRLDEQQRDQADITVSLSPIALDIVGRDVASKRRPVSVVDGQFSAYFQIAAALLYGNQGWAVYDHLGSEEINHAIDRIDIIPSTDVEPAGAFLTIGHEQMKVTTPSGEPGISLDNAVVENKFRAITSTVWSRSRQDEIIAAIDALHHTSADELIPLLRG